MFIDSSLRGVMNALELCMYARGLEIEHAAQLVVVGAVSDKDRSMFAAGVQFVSDDAGLALTVLDRVRTCATTPQRRRKARSTISG